MRFLVDECTGPAVAKWLRLQSHDVYSVFDDARGMSDDDILKVAIDDDRILITNDKDFGELVFRERRSHRGVVLLRLANERSTQKIEVLDRLLVQYADRLAGRFVVVSESQIRFAR